MIRSSAPSSGCERSSRWQADPGWSAGHCQGSGWRGRRWYDGGADRRWGPEAASPPGGLGIAAVPAEAAAAGSCRGRRSAGAAPRAAERRYMYIYIYIYIFYYDYYYYITITKTNTNSHSIYIYIYIYIYVRRGGSGRARLHTSSRGSPTRNSGRMGKLQLHNFAIRGAYFGEGLSNNIFEIDP